MYFDEVYGFIPPHPSSPPSKRLLMLLIKQARAFGVGVVLATQNPVDIDYKVLTNAGIWMIGRLQTENDIDRVSEGLRIATGSGSEAKRLIPRLPKRTFLVKDVKDKELAIYKTRWAMTYLRGPMTLAEVAKTVKHKASSQKVAGEERENTNFLHAPPLIYDDFDQAFLQAEPGAKYKPVLYGQATVYITRSRPPVDIQVTIMGAADPMAAKLEFKDPRRLGLPEKPLSKAQQKPPSKAFFKNLPETYTKKVSLQEG